VVEQRQGRVRKYERIAEDLRALIRFGKLLDGDRLPGENELMQRYGVARMTARQALADLRNEGLAVGRKGAGVFVRTFRPVRRLGNRRLGRDVWGAGRSMWDVDTDVPVTIDQLVVDETPAPEGAARLLGIPAGTPVVVRRRRYSVNAEPVQLATSYLPAEIAAGTPIVTPHTGPGGVYARLAELGHAPVRFTEELHARMPTRAEADKLQLAPGIPVICVARTALAADDRPVEASEMTLSAAACLLSYDFDA
jgi:GntR family transcriptional regulator